ncbi:MAG: 3-dehydroquinate synthase [Bacteroidota bacterium]
MTSFVSTSLTVHLPEGRGYPVYFGGLADVPQGLREAGLRSGRCVVVTDTNVGPLYAAPLTEALAHHGWTPTVLTVPAGESTKSLERLSALYDALLPLHLDRHTPILALGGGVVGDLAGFAAATVLRGVPLVQLPTSLVAQVDSAIGGKTGINHAVGKNLIGAFHQPTLVCADLTTLHTLPDREWTGGLSEAFKHALIADPELLADLLRDAIPLRDRHPATVAHLVPRVAAVKVATVSADEREAGARAHLNFGHTFGHALERVAGYGVVTHGEAVAVGMRAAVYASAQRHPHVDFEPAWRLLDHLPRPVIPASVSIASLMEAMRYDKKVQDGRIRYVLLQAPGSAYVTDALESAEVEAAWRVALERLAG